MRHELIDDSKVTISISISRDLQARLNAAARLSPEVRSRSQLVEDLLDLALDTLLEPETTLPAIIAGLKDAADEAEAADPNR